MKKKKGHVYNPEIELAKGATLDAAAYDKTQKIKVTAAKVTVGGIPGRAEISGIATGHIPEAGLEGVASENGKNRTLRVSLCLRCQE